MRKLASIRRIHNILPIEGADAIELAQVDGWQSVIKKGEYQIGDLVVYLEVDSWVPHELAPFLTKPNQDCRQYNGVNGQRLRTMKLRGALSQGLILPLKPTCSNIESELFEGLDVSVPLNIQKWEPVVPAQLAGLAKGVFPSEIPKTDQERVQNLDLSQYCGEHYEVTEKLHGSSCTFYLDSKGEFHVCSRNLSLKPDPNNAYWKMAYHYDVEAKMREHELFGHAIQGELCGEGINGNNYQLKLDFFVFDIYVEAIGYSSSVIRRLVAENLGLKHVPVIHEAFLLKQDKEALLGMAEGESVLAKCKREGLVFKSNQSDKTFKAVSNSWLLKYE